MIRVFYLLAIFAAILTSNKLLAGEDLKCQSASQEVIILDEDDDSFIAEMDMEWEEDEYGDVVEGDDNGVGHKYKKKDGDKQKNKYKKHKKSPKKKKNKGRCKMTCSKNRNAFAGPNAFK